MTTTESHVRAGGFRTRVLEAGDREAPPVLLLHDGAWGGSSSGSWDAVIPQLAKTHRVIAPDMLGFGGTDKAVFFDRSPHSFRIAHLGELMRTLCVDRPVHVVGNSFGGAVALRAVAEGRALWIRSATSVAGSGGPWRTAKAISELGHWDGGRDDLTRIADLLVDRFEGYQDHVDERLRWAAVPGHARSVLAPTLAIPDTLRVAVDDPWPAQLEGVDVPLLLVRCLRDELLEPTWAAHVAAAAKDARVVEIDDRHAPNIDRPGEFLSVLLPFLAEVERHG